MSALPARPPVGESWRLRVWHRLEQIRNRTQSIAEGVGVEASSQNIQTLRLFVDMYRTLRSDYLFMEANGHLDIDASRPLALRQPYASRFYFADNVYEANLTWAVDSKFIRSSLYAAKGRRASFTWMAMARAFGVPVHYGDEESLATLNKSSEVGPDFLQQIEDQLFADHKRAVEQSHILWTKLSQPSIGPETMADMHGVLAAWHYTKVRSDLLGSFLRDAQVYANDKLSLSSKLVRSAADLELSVEKLGHGLSEIMRAYDVIIERVGHDHKELQDRDRLRLERDLGMDPYAEILTNPFQLLREQFGYRKDQTLFAGTRSLQDYSRPYSRKMIIEWQRKMVVVQYLVAVSSIVGMLEKRTWRAKLERQRVMLLDRFWTPSGEGDARQSLSSTNASTAPGPGINRYGRLRRPDDGDFGPGSVTVEIFAWAHNS